MQKKIILAIITTAVVAAALVGVTVAQLAGAQTQNATAPQLVQLPNGQYAYGVQTSNGTLVIPCYPYGAVPSGTQVPQQSAAPYVSGYGYGGMGMCGRFW